MNNSTENGTGRSSKRKKGFVMAVIGALVATAAVGGSYASLTTTIQTPDNNRVYLDTGFDFDYTAASQPIVKDITPGQPAETFMVQIQNGGKLTANYGFWIANADQLELPEVALDNTTVRVSTSPTGEGGTTTWAYTTTLRGFLDNATVSAWSDEASITPGTLKSIYITITPDSSGSEWADEDFGDFEMTFATAFTLSQVVGGVSDLKTFAQANGTQMVAYGSTFDIFTIPVEDVDAASRTGLSATVVESDN